MKLSRRILSLGLLSLAACSTDVTTPRASLPEGGPSEEIQHEWTNGAYGLLFLPNTVPSGYPAFDGNVQPTLRMCRITNITTGACTTTPVTWTRATGNTANYNRNITVSSTAYSLSWPVTSTSGMASGQTYRLTVIANNRTLGWQDVRIVSTTAQFNAVDTDDFKPCYNTGNCVISWRLSVGMPSSITLSTSSVSLNVGDGVVVTGTVRDLRGNVMSNAPVSLELESASSPAAAQLDSGMVVAKNVGTSTLWAGYLDLWEDIPVTVTDTRRAWVRLTSKDDQGNRGIWGTAANNVYTANYMGLWKYNGTTWATVPEARWRTFYDVYGTAANNVFAVGANGLIMRYNGTTWSAQRYNGVTVANEALQAPVTPARKYTLRALWGLPAQNFTVTVGDSGTVLYHDGNTWTDFSVPTDAALTDVWGTDYNNFYATTSDGRLMRWNGYALSYVPGVESEGALHAVWGTSSSNMYVAGDGGALYRFNGTTWTQIRLPTRATLYAIWGTSATNMFVGGEDGALYRYDGTSWIPEKSNGGASQIYGFWGTSSGADLFASGAGGLVIKR